MWGDVGGVCLPRTRSYANRANDGGERVWKRGDQEMGSSDRPVQVTSHGPMSQEF